MEFLTEIRQARTLQKIVKILYYLKLCLENIFWVNSLFHSSKERFLQNFRQFLENWIFDGNSTGADLTKNSENFVLSEIVLRNYFLSKFFIPLIKGKVSTKFEAIFGKLNFWQKFDRRGPCKNSENFWLS